MPPHLELPPNAAGFTPAWVGQALAQLPRLAHLDATGVVATRIGEGFGLDGVLVRLEGLVGGLGSLVAKVCGAKRGCAERDFLRGLGLRLPCRVPVLHGSLHDEANDRAILFLEDLGAADQGDALVGVTLDRAGGVVRAIAAMHAAHWECRDSVVAALPLFATDVQRMQGWVEAGLEVSRQRFADVVRPQDQAILSALPHDMEHVSQVLGDATLTLIHGDLHGDNILYDEDEPILLDWPDARRGPGTVDLVRFLVEGLRADQHAAWQADLYRVYLDALHEHGIDLDARRLHNECAAWSLWLLARSIAWSGADNPGLETPRVEPLIRALLGNALETVRRSPTRR